MLAAEAEKQIRKPGNQEKIRIRVNHSWIAGLQIRFITAAWLFAGSSSFHRLELDRHLFYFRLHDRVVIAIAHLDRVGVSACFKNDIILLGLRDSLRTDRLRMVQDFIAHLVFIQTVDQSLRYFHERPPGNKTITFLMYLYFSDRL